MLNSHCGNDHKSLQFILENMKEKLAQHVNDVPISFDPTRLLDEGTTDEEGTDLEDN